MKFKNFKNTIERPYMIYADLESTLIKTGNTKNIVQEHKPNSCCYYFVCSFDSSRNELLTFEGENCVEEMIISMYELSENVFLK
jgi:hypothetical protein